MKKHMLTNHEDHQFKECQEKLPTFMELLKHVAKHHFKDQGNIEDLNSEEDECDKQKDTKFKSSEESENKNVKDILSEVQ